VCIRVRVFRFRALLCLSGKQRHYSRPILFWLSERLTLGGSPHRATFCELCCRPPRHIPIRHTAQKLCRIHGLDRCAALQSGVTRNRHWRPGREPIIVGGDGQLSTAFIQILPPAMWTLGCRVPPRCHNSLNGVLARLEFVTGTCVVSEQLRHAR
jgi:hypothetical protein